VDHWKFFKIIGKRLRRLSNQKNAPATNELLFREYNTNDRPAFIT
jgi:hypothetical protein